jgi:hypothetical protein
VWRAVVYTSTTSAFGEALVPAPGTPAAWITESVRPVPKNIYGVTKVANELLFRRVDIEDVVTAHLLALEKASSIGLGRCVISATTPFGVGPRYSLGTALERVDRGEDPRSDLARVIGTKGYHPEAFADGPYPVSGES